MNTTEFVTLFTLMIPVILTYIKSRQNELSLKEVKVQVNGKIDELIKVTRESAYSEGKLAGVEESRIIAKELLHEKSERVDEKLNTIHTTFNSKMDEMIKIIKERAYAEGKLAGAEENRQIMKDIIKKNGIDMDKAHSV